jgi:transcription initiation factor IIF auxiliary subunit
LTTAAKARSVDGTAGQPNLVSKPNNDGAAMSVFSNQSLVYLVQLVDEERMRLKADIADRDEEDPFLPDIKKSLLDCLHAGAELRAIYEAAERSSGDLPRYTRLVDN